MRAQIEAALTVMPAPSAAEAPLAERDLRAVFSAIDDLARIAKTRADEVCRHAFELPAAPGEGVSAVGDAIARIRAQVSHAEVESSARAAAELDRERSGRVVGLLDFVEANLGDMMATWSDLEALHCRTGSSAG